MFFNKGENCIAAGRLFVENSIHDQFVQKVVSSAEGLGAAGSPVAGAQGSEMEAGVWIRGRRMWIQGLGCRCRGRGCGYRGWDVDTGVEEAYRGWGVDARARLQGGCPQIKG